jgi:hypothetical protein
MGTGIQNLDRESLLVLYAADELSAEDRARVDAMLASDASLRAELDELTAAQQVMAAGFAQADATRPLPAPVSSSVRNVSIAMKQWQIDRMARPTVVIRNGRRFGWMYGVGAVAAAVIISFFILWSRVDDGKNDALSQFIKDNTSQQQDDQKQATPDDQPALADNAQPVEDPAVNDYTPGGGESDQQLSRAEGEMYTLSALTDSLRPNDETVTP